LFARLACEAFEHLNEIATFLMPSQPSTIRVLSLVEAATINAVAKNVLEFSRSARELNKRNFNFPQIDELIVTFDRRDTNDKAPNEFVIAARELGLEVQLIPERRRFDVNVIPALRRIVAETKPDLIVTHSVKSHFILWRSRLWRTVPWIAFHHGYTTTDRKMRVYNRLDRWSLPKADQLMTVCKAFARTLADATGAPVAKIVVQHNSIRLRPPASAEAVRDLRARLRIADEERIVLSIGRLSREKAHSDLISAFKLLRDTHPETKCKLVIVGDGPERARLEAGARSSGVQSDVIFTGQQSDVQPFYGVADVFVLPSRSEGSPNVLLEAMVAGVPIVATHVGGVPEIVETNQSALLVPPNHPRELADAITRVLIETDLARRLTSNASAIVATRFSPDEYVRCLLATYVKTIRGRQEQTSQR
jgi:glycosyltransferase involved in cell wall biosynthesis